MDEISDNLGNMFLLYIGYSIGIIANKYGEPLGTVIGIEVAKPTSNIIIKKYEVFHQR